MLSATQTISGLAPKTVQYAYDASGNRQQVIYPSGKTLDYTYDDINRLTDIDQNSASLAHFDYDVLNRRTLKSFPSTPSLESAYSYYFDNRLDTLVNRINGGGVISQNQYTYDNVGNRLSHTSLAQSFTYGYNDIYELTSVSGSEAHSYLYDNVGNRATADSVNYVANSLNQYTSVGSQTLTYDTNGNLTDDGTNTYAYDEENRLLTADNINHSAAYTYDPFNRRVSNTVDGVTAYYVYDGDEVIAEYDVGGLLTAEYTYADSIDEVLTMDRNGNTYYYHYDGLGSVTEVTDAAGAVQESYKYDPYGHPSIFDSVGSPLTTSAIGNRYMYTGREWDAESEIYYYRARMYDPTIGRFLQRDPKDYIDSMNLYSYVLNRPINFIDPSGQYAETPFDYYSWQFSLYFFAEDPSLITFLSLAWDSYALVTPPNLGGIAFGGYLQAANKGRKMVGDKVVRLIKHHIASNKHLTKYTPKFKAIADKYGLKLTGSWNTIEIPDPPPKS